MKNQSKKQSTLESKDFRTKPGKQQDDEALPGYPHYPESEDILDPDNAQQVPIDVENITRTGEVDVTTLPPPVTDEGNEADENVLSEKTDADITSEDLAALGDIDQDMDLGEDETLIAGRGRPIDMTGEALDVPGGELDDANEEIGEEDEENNFYSRPD